MSEAADTGGTAGIAASGLDETFHARARLGIMTLLLSWGEADFPTLKRELDLTDGNLGAHLRVLEDGGFVEVEKGFVGRKPKTTCRPSDKGRRAFRKYLDQLEAVIRHARDG